jgi:hypothetical protein
LQPQPLEIIQEDWFLPKEHVFANIQRAKSLMTQLKFEAPLDRFVQDYKHVGIK